MSALDRDAVMVKIDARHVRETVASARAVASEAMSVELDDVIAAARTMGQISALAVLLADMLERAHKMLAQESA